MAVEQPPGIVNDIATGAKIHRHVVQALAGHPVGAFAGGISAIGMAHGICYPSALAVSQSASLGMRVDVAAGPCFITGTSSAEMGPYVAYNDAIVQMNVGAAHPTNPRKDLLIAQIRDDDYDGGSTVDARLFVVPGTAAGSPSDPSLSLYPNALVLARINVPAAATQILNANIDDLRLGARASAWYQAWGKVAYNQVVASQSGISTVADLTGLTAAWTAVPGRAYRISSLVLLLQSTSGGIAEVSITTNGNTQVQTLAITLAASAYGPACPSVVLTGLSGAVSYKLRAKTTAGTVGIQALSTSPAFILVEDIGPA